MYPDWVKIYTAETPYNADLIIGLLNEHGVEAVTFSKQDSIYLLGEIEVYVHRDMVVLAKHILEENKN